MEALVNNTEKSFGLGKIWSDAVSFFTNNYANLFLVIIMLLVGIMLIRLLNKFLKRIFTRNKMDGIMQSFVLGAVRFVAYVLLVVILLGQMGLQITGVVAALSAALLAIGMAIKENIANLASGIIIACSNLYHEGDYIEVEGKEGVIDHISIMFTVLYTYEKQKVIIPNSKITASSVVNVYTNNLRRVTVNLKVAYNTDLEKAKKVVVDAFLSDKRVMNDPKPFCALKDMGDSALELFCTYWCDSKDYWDVYFSVRERVFNEFKRNGICIPYGQLEVRLRDDTVIMPVSGQTPSLRETSDEEYIRHDIHGI